MLDPTPLPAEAVPSSFLPYLHRDQTTLSPFSSHTLLGHIALLRELYLPPIHGGFRPIDVSDLDDGSHSPRSTKERRFSAGLAETMDGLGLGLVVGSPSRQPVIADTIFEHDEDNERDDETSEGKAEASTDHLEPFERDWAERWLNGVVRRAQSWLEEHEAHEDLHGFVAADGAMTAMKGIEVVLRDATAVLAMMAGTSAAGSLTRHLLFPVDPSLSQALRQSNRARPTNPDLSPETTTFLSSLSISPASPITFVRRPDPSLSPEMSGCRRRPRTSTGRSTSDISTSPESAFSTGRSKRKRRRPAIPILLHDAPMADHLSVGVQTWGSAILLGREMAMRPTDFGLFPPDKSIRVLELGAGTGLLSILCRKLLDLHHATLGTGGTSPGLVVATDFHPDVLSNLKVCVDLNSPPHTNEDGAAIMSLTDNSSDSGLHIAKLDWATLPVNMQASTSSSGGAEEAQEITRFLDRPFDVVLASDCVYDPNHADLLRQVASWVLRPPSGPEDDIGGTFHILSPLRPTFAPELEAVDKHFPTLPSIVSAPVSEKRCGEGLGQSMGLSLGTRGQGKRSVRGKKGEGRADETEGYYWWWEVGWGCYSSVETRN